MKRRSESYWKLRYAAISLVIVSSFALVLALIVMNLSKVLNALDDFGEWSEPFFHVVLIVIMVGGAFLVLWYIIYSTFMDIREDRLLRRSELKHDRLFETEDEFS